VGFGPRLGAAALSGFDSIHSFFWASKYRPSLRPCGAGVAASALATSAAFRDDRGFFVSSGHSNCPVCAL
jgi:hypothetical protein